MRTWFISAAALVFAMAAPDLANSAPDLTYLQGTIVAQSSRWTSGQQSIITESTLRLPDGETVTIHQPGGSVDGVGMWVSHSPPVLSIGDTVSVDASLDTTSRQDTRYKLRKIHTRQPAADDKNRRDFVRAATEQGRGTPIYWASGCAIINIATEGSTQIAGNAEFDTIDDVLTHWQSSTRSCSAFELINDGPKDLEVGLDGINIIKFRESDWCRPKTDDKPEQCHDEAAAGITTIFFVENKDSDRDGEILDADIELNGVQFAFSVDGETLGTQQCKSDLANTLTHELGHFLGLSHTCRLPGDPESDSDGNPIPLCTGNGITSEITDATMYNFQSCGETQKSSLEADDIAGMCAIYPADEHPNSCKPASLTNPGCCSIAGKRSQPRGLLLLLALPFIALLFRRRRRN